MSSATTWTGAAAVCVSQAIPKRPVNGVTAKHFISNDNPFFGVTDALEELLAIGLRDPHRMTFDLVSRCIFIGEVGAGSRASDQHVVLHGKAMSPGVFRL